MNEQVKLIETQFAQDIESVSSSSGLESLRVKYLGRKSELTALFSKIPLLTSQEKSLWGRKLNVLKQTITKAIEEKNQNIGSKQEDLDLTFPSSNINIGSEHILSKTTRQICSIFKRLGFAIIAGDEIEDEHHNFEALNFPADHPSKDDFDTFYLDLPKTQGGKHLLRCHTSPSQIRVMKKHKPPLAVISPGRVYRPDEVDATHSFMFHQIEGFVVSEDTNFAHLKGVLLAFAREFFSKAVKLRFRPHFFPFTEPSAEADLSCIICGQKKNSQKKCSVCKDKGWLEILGCGMIHPKVLKACDIDSKKYKGFAFGMGVDRIAMLRYGINDIRLFYENDLRFLNQFK